METRKKAIQSHLKPLNLPHSLLEEATFIALECTKLVTRLTKICAAIGLVLTYSNRGLPESQKSVCEKLNIKYRNFSKHFSKIKLRPSVMPCKKIPKLEEILEKVHADPDTREKAYSLMSSKTCSTPLKAVGEALIGCSGLPLLTQQSPPQLEIKHNKNLLLEKNSELRIQNLILHKQSSFDTLPSLSLLDLEKSVMMNALGISYLNFNY